MRVLVLFHTTAGIQEAESHREQLSGRSRYRYRFTYAWNETLKKAPLLILFVILSICPLAMPGEDDLVVFNHAYERYVEFYDQGHFSKSLPEARLAYELGKQLLGAQHKDTANLAYNYGDNLLRLGKYEEARSILREALDSYEKLHGKESVELISVLMSLGHANANTNRIRSKKSLYKRAFKLAKQQYGEDSADFGMFSVRSGTAMLNQAHGTQGVGHLRTGYDILKASLGGDHVSTGIAAYQLGVYELSRDRYKAARRYLLEALAIFERPEKPSNKFELSTHTFLIRVFEELGESDLATEHCLAIGRMTPFESAQDYFPLYKQPPAYPRSALRRGVEGYVILEYSVDENGFVREPKIVKHQGHPDFEVAAFSAVRKFRYAPRFVDGKPVMVKGVQNKFTFTITR